MLTLLATAAVPSAPPLTSSALDVSRRGRLHAARTAPGGTGWWLALLHAPGGQ